MSDTAGMNTLATLAMLSLSLVQPETKTVDATNDPSVTITAEPAGATNQADKNQGSSLLGKPLVLPQLDEARRAALEVDLEKARVAYQANAANEDAAIWYGRRLAYLGEFREAIEVYTAGLKANPESYKLLRHRGHRYITLRRFDEAVTDLTKAWALAQHTPDAPETDGAPVKPGAEPRSTDRSNILYHLGLAYYLKGEFALALEVFDRRQKLESFNDDMLVSSLHWEYMCLRRMGKETEARDRLRVLKPFMDVRENASYYNMCRMYLGEFTPEQTASMTQAGSSGELGTLYGIGNWKLYHGDVAGAKEVFTKIVMSENWPAFGYVAAEAELARMDAKAATAEQK
jgi:tetratricopeptide (TPR) repeat protein